MINNYIVVGSRPWNEDMYKRKLLTKPGLWHYISATEDGWLDTLREKASESQPRYIFFVHCSEIVPADIYDTYECVVFHPTPLPYGRGGSPIQNMILMGHDETKVSAFRMTGELDAGPVYMQLTLSLRGSLADIFDREMYIVEQIINYMIKNDITPLPQANGDSAVFRRRKPWQSEVGDQKTIAELYDHIRMLDADTYPRAYLCLGEGIELVFSNAHLRGNKLTVDVELRDEG